MKNKELAVQCRRMYHLNHSVDHIASVKGLTVKQVREMLDLETVIIETKIPNPKQSNTMNNERKTERRRLTAKQKNQIRKLHKQGMTYIAIADVVGCGEATVGRTVRGETRTNSKPVAKQVATKRVKASKPKAQVTTKNKTEFSLFWGAIKFSRAQ